MYRVHLKLAERTEPLSAEIALQPGQSWQEAVEYTLDQVGADQRVEFWLERKGTELPYRKLWLWVNVRAAEAP